MTLDGCEGCHGRRERPRTLRGRCDPDGRILPLPQPGDSFDGLVAFKEFHEASGNTVSFHHVFDFTVTRVSKNEAAWKESKSWQHVDAALRRQDKYCAACAGAGVPFQVF
jgi:hypothetical protein